MLTNLSVTTGFELRSSLTITDFCRIVGISTPTYYKLKARGLAPREMRLGSAIRISAAAVDDWQRERENPTGPEAAERRAHEERLRRRSRVANGLPGEAR